MLVTRNLARSTRLLGTAQLASHHVPKAAKRMTATDAAVAENLDLRYPIQSEVPKQEYDARWERIWAVGLPPGQRWDIGGVAPSLKQLLDSKEMDVTGKRCIVPGCGRGYDVTAFVQAGAEAAFGLDLAQTACKEAELQVSSSGLDAVQQSHARIVCADFFEWQDPQGTGFDVGFDYTFGCAMHPSMRETWAANWARLVKPGGTLCTLIFPVVPPGVMLEGPPFPVSTELYSQLLEGAGFEQLALSAVPQGSSAPGRAGKEWLGLWRRRSG